jgi:hypothetical protein
MTEQEPFEPQNTLGGALEIHHCAVKQKILLAQQNKFRV